MRRQFTLSVPFAALALLAVVVASGTGGAVGAALVTGTDIADGSVGGIDIKDESLTASDIRDQAVGSPDVRNGSVAPVDLKDNAMWALVNASGFLTHSNGVVEVVRPGINGITLVRFARPIDNRPVLATVHGFSGDKGIISFVRCVGATNPCSGYGDYGADWVAVRTEYALSGMDYRGFQIVALPDTPGTVIAP